MYVGRWIGTSPSNVSSIIVGNYFIYSCLVASSMRSFFRPHINWILCFRPNITFDLTLNEWNDWNSELGEKKHVRNSLISIVVTHHCLLFQYIDRIEWQFVTVSLEGISNPEHWINLNLNSFPKLLPRSKFSWIIYIQL